MSEIAAMVQFLSQLAANNNKPWFDAHKSEYVGLRRGFTEAIQQVIFRVGEVDPSLDGLRAEETLFRIYRDVRFSKDKTPYKTVFSASICPAGKASGLPTYYVQVNEVGEMLTAAGVYMPEPATANLIRRAIVEDPKRVEHILSDTRLRGAFLQGLSGESLKRAPKGFEEGDPHIDLVKLKNFVLWSEQAIPDGWTEADLVEGVSAKFCAAAPWVGFLRDALPTVRSAA